MRFITIPRIPPNVADGESNDGGESLTMQPWEAHRSARGRAVPATQKCTTSPDPAQIRSADPPYVGTAGTLELRCQSSASSPDELVPLSTAVAGNAKLEARPTAKTVDEPTRAYQGQATGVANFTSETAAIPARRPTRAAR